MTKEQMNTLFGLMHPDFIDGYYRDEDKTLHTRKVCYAVHSQAHKELDLVYDSWADAILEAIKQDQDGRRAVKIAVIDKKRHVTLGDFGHSVIKEWQYILT